LDIDPLVHTDKGEIEDLRVTPGFGFQLPFTKKEKDFERTEG
jgi:hypothetical protein